MINLLSPLRGLRRRSSATAKRLPEATYIELVQSLFGFVLAPMIMTLCFVGTGLYILTRNDDRLLLDLYIMGLAASAVRLLTLFGHRDAARSTTISASVARRIERRFALSYFAFAAAFGAFAARAYWVVDSDLHKPLVALVFGYGAGVAATVSLRPWISITAILAAIVPMILVSLLVPGGADRATAVLTILFLAGGIMSMVRRCRETAAQISLRRLMETLARQDDLTGLPNRLALRERFEQFTARSDGSELIAVHCVDINRLEPVNEMYGHMAGDALLKAVSQRLRRVVRGDNLVIRLHGDDFVIVQPDMGTSAEAEALAHQIVGTLDKSYAVGGEDIIITANLGYAVDLQWGADLEQLLLRAERALAKGKRKSSGVALDDGTYSGASLRQAG